MNSTCLKIYMNSTYLKTYMNSTYLKIYMNSTCLKIYMNSTYFKIYMNSTCLKIYMNSTYLKIYMNSTYLRARPRGSLAFSTSTLQVSTTCFKIAQETNRSFKVSSKTTFVIISKIMNPNQCIVIQNMRNKQSYFSIYTM